MGEIELPPITAITEVDRNGQFILDSAKERAINEIEEFIRVTKKINIKDIANIRISFLKSIYGNNYITILGALGSPGNTVKLSNERGVSMGVFKVLDSVNGSTLKKIKAIKGNTIYDVYLFDKKI